MKSEIQDVDSPIQQGPGDPTTGSTDSAPPKRSRSRGRGGRRRSSAPREPETAVADATTEPVRTEAEAVTSVADQVGSALDVAVPSEQLEVVGQEPEPAAGAPSRGRRRTAKATASPVDVNVVVARGLTRRVDTKLVRQVVERAIQKNGWEQPATVDVVFVSDADMQEINATRRGVDEVTDVLAFPVLDLRPGQGLTQDFFVLPPDTTPHLGDVLISVDRFESQADEAGHSRQRELAFLTVHGVLHILGYDHETDEERRTMRRREEEVLSELGLRRDGA